MAASAPVWPLFGCEAAGFVSADVDLAGATRRNSGWPPASASTFWPGRTRCRPLTMTCSPALQPGRDDPHVAALAAQFHGAPRRDAVAADDVDEFDVLIGGQGPLGNQQRLVGLARRNPHAHEQAAGQGAILVGEYAAQAGRAGAGVDLGLDEIELSLVREILLVGELHVTVDAQFAQAAGRRFARLIRAAACSAAATAHRRRSRRTSAAR